VTIIFLFISKFQIQWLVIMLDSAGFKQDNVSVERHVYPSSIVSVSEHYQYPAKHVGPAQHEHNHHLIKLVLIMI
jgi:hypothetical protein